MKNLSPWPTLFMAGILWGAAVSSAAQECSQPLGQWPYGVCSAVLVREGQVIFNDGLALVIADAADPSHPSRIGEIILDDLSIDLAASGSAVYAAIGEKGLAVVDASDPAHPIVTERLAAPWPAERVTAGPGLVCVAGTGTDEDGVAGTHLWVLTAEDPAHPVPAAEYDLAGSLGFGGLAQAGDRAYIISSSCYPPFYGCSNALDVLDLSNPANPHPVNGIIETGWPDYWRGAAVQGQMLLIASSVVGMSMGGLYVFDIGDPVHPDLVGADFWEGAGAHAVSADATHAYITDLGGTLVIENISSPDSPFEMGRYSGPWESPDYYEGAWRAFITGPSGPVLYVGAWDHGLRAVEVSDPSVPSDAGEGFAQGRILNFAVERDRVYLVGEASGLTIVGVTENGETAGMGRWTGRGCADVAVRGGLAYVADGTPGGLRIVDVSDPTAAREIGSLAWASPAIAVDVSGAYAYLIDFGTLHVVDVSDPAIPVQVGDLAQYSPYDLQLRGGTAYTVGYSGLGAVDISDPAHPRRAGMLGSADGRDLDVSPRRPLAFVAKGGWGGVDIVDVSDPAAMNLVTHLSMDEDAYGVHIEEPYLFVGTEGAGLWIYDVEDPSNPVLAARVDVPGNLTKVEFFGGWVQLLDPRRGLRIVDVRDCIPKWSTHGRSLTKPD